jgi:SH3-like domain-containing protein
VDCVWDGAEVQLGDGVQHSDALTWRQVPGLGWVAEQFLRRTRAVISSTGSCLNVRDTPSTLGAVLTCLPEGTPVTLGESTAGEFGAWTHVTRGDQAGWVLEGFLS